MDDDDTDAPDNLPEPDAALNDLARRVLDACIAVHDRLGPGLLESHYCAALAIELRKRNIPFVREAEVVVEYDEQQVGTVRLDLIIDRRLVFEAKSVEDLTKLHRVQTRTYLKLLNLRLGLLVNFNVERLMHGVKRVLNPRYRP